MLYTPPVAAAPAGYTGAGDVVSGAYAWYGLRGYTAAYSTGSNPALDLVDQAGANPLTANILSNGRLDVASISAWVTANSVTTIKITRIYDQTGNTRHVDQATLGNMPVLNLTGFGSLPSMDFTAASSHFLESSATVTQAQPFSFATVQLRGSASGNIVINSTGVRMRTVSGGIEIHAGANAQALTAANGSWHAVQSVFNNTSSAICVDGTETTGLTVGTATPSSSTIAIGKTATVASFDGSMAEVGLWPSGFTTGGGGQVASMNTTQHGTDGYNF